MKSSKDKISVVHRIVCLLLAAYLLNFSIDSRDAHSDSVAEDLSINDIESVYELLAEGVAGVENAVEEHDERDQEEGGSFEFKKSYFIVKVPFVQVRAAYLIQPVRAHFDYNETLLIRALEINSPPPKA